MNPLPHAGGELPLAPGPSLTKVVLHDENRKILSPLEDVRTNETGLLAAGTLLARVDARRREAMMTHTHTYAVLEISAAAYQDVRERLVKAAGKVDFEGSYQGEEDDGAELLVLGTVALKAAPLVPSELTYVPPSRRTGGFPQMPLGAHWSTKAEIVQCPECGRRDPVWCLDLGGVYTCQKCNVKCVHISDFEDWPNFWLWHRFHTGG